MDDFFDTTEEGFTIDSDMRAEWALKKIKEAKAEHDRLQALAQGEIEELVKKIEELDQQLDSRTGFLKSKLYEYFQTVEHKSTKTKESYSLLSGSLVWDKPVSKIKRPDDKVLLDIMKKNGADSFIEVAEKPKWADYKKTLNLMGEYIVNDSGEIIEGLEIEDVPGKFEIK